MSQFIVLEGPDGVGKSSIAKALYNCCNQKNISAIHTFEPTERVNRDELFKLNPAQRYQLFLDDREWHITQRVNPALKSGTHVICDRYLPSTLVYQTLDHTDYEEIKQELSRFQKPDWLIYVQAPFDAVSSELEQRTILYSYEQLEFRKKVESQYQFVIADLEQDGWNVLRLSNDFTESIESLAQTLFNKIFL